MTRARDRFRLPARLALAAVTAVAATAALAPAQAGAQYISFYNCTSKPVGLWCDGRANSSFDGIHSWDSNIAYFDGSWDSTVIMCEHLWRPATSTERAGATCAYNWTSNVYGDVACICYEAEVRQYSSGNRNISGEADADLY